MHNNKPHQSQPQLFEGLDHNDLARLVSPELHIDEFQSKMGSDEDIIVLSFKVNGKEPASDLMSFIERGYEWILDSDVSSGELDDGEYLVFAELERDHKAPDRIMQLLDDVMNLTDQDLTDWQFVYHKGNNKHDITADAISDLVPLSPARYRAKYGQDDELEAMKESARISTKRQAPINSWTDSLRVAAGLK